MAVARFYAKNAAEPEGTLGQPDFSGAIGTLLGWTDEGKEVVLSQVKRCQRSIYI